MKRKPTRRNILLTFDSNYSSSRRVASGALRRIAEIPDYILLQTGETFIRTIDCTLSCIDDDYNELFSCPIRLELEFDARAMVADPAQ